MTAPADHAQQEQQVQTLLQQGLAVREVARRTGAAYSTVRTIAVRMGRHMSRGHKNKEDH